MKNNLALASFLLLIIAFVTAKVPIPIRRLPLLKVRGGESDQGGGFKSEFIVGKDREIFHASIDLKWLYEKITDKSLWKGFFRSIAESVKTFDPSYKIESDFRKSAVLYATNIKSQRANSTLRVFSSSLLQAQQVARETGRYIAYYCEEDMVGIMPTYLMLAFRRALTDANVEDLLNEQFIFMASDIMHPYAEHVVKLAKLAGLNGNHNHHKKNKQNNPTTTAYDFPLLIILSPKPLTTTKPSATKRFLSWWYKKEPIELDVLGMVSLNGQDITGYYLYEFLLTILHVHNQQRSETVTNRDHDNDREHEENERKLIETTIIRSDSDSVQVSPEVIDIE